MTTMILSRRCCMGLCRHQLRAALVGSSGGRQSIRTNTTTSSDDILLRNDIDGISTLTLNRPKQYNTLTSALLDDMQGELKDLSQDSAIKVIVFKSSSANCFSAGHDLREMLHSSQEEIQELFQKCSNTMSFLTQQLPQPVIAQVHGIATAAGCQLVASCDLAICSNKTKFGVNGIDVGLFCSTPAVALSRNIPRKHAMRMLLTGDFISAQEALQYGLVNQVVPVEELDDVTMTLARKIASKSSYATQLGKQAFYKQLEIQSLEKAHDFAGETMCRNMESHDAQEGIQAFLEKRTPEWEGK